MSLNKQSRNRLWYLSCDISLLIKFHCYSSSDYFQPLRKIISDCVANLLRTLCFPELFIIWSNGTILNLDNCILRIQLIFETVSSLSLAIVQKSDFYSSAYHSTLEFSHIHIRLYFLIWYWFMCERSRSILGNKTT